MENKPTPIGIHWLQNLSKGARIALSITAMYLILIAIAFALISPEQYNLKAGDVAPKTITASRDMIDEVTTEKRRTAAAAAVSNVYYKDETVSESVLKELDDVFAELRSVRELGEQIREGWTERTGSFNESDYAQASKLLSMMTLNNYQLRTLMNTSKGDFENLYQSLASATRTVLVSNINQGQIDNAVSNIQQIVAYNTRTDLWYNIGIPALRKLLRANMLIDEEATEQNRQKARDAVEPTMYKKGQNIVVRGDRVTAEQIDILNALGLIRGDSVNLYLYLGAALLIVILLGLVFLTAYLLGVQDVLLTKNALVMFICAATEIILAMLFAAYSQAALMPVILAGMLAANLIGQKPAYILNSVLALFLTLLAFRHTNLQDTDVLGLLLMASAGGTLAIWLMRRSPTRMMILFYGLLCGVANMLILACVRFVMTTESWQVVFMQCAPAMIGALISAVLSISLQPVLESLFNLVTPSKLMELSNPNQPLLRRLMIEAPGTYHHSMIVANLAEAAADEVGVDALLARVGAYYHDIGKLSRPQYFKENQVGENPHDHTEPQVSAAILTEHTRDGVELAKKHHLPDAIIDLILQHHGNTPVMYFYAKAVKQNGEENVDIANFRYDGPKPQTAEAAILMLADTVEAAVRSIPDPTQEKIRTAIRKLVRGKMEDGQLDECTLTFRDIDKICHAFEMVLQGVFHERIEYPDLPSRASRGRRSQRHKPKQEART